MQKSRKTKKECRLSIKSKNFYKAIKPKNINEGLKPKMPTGNKPNNIDKI